MDTNSNTPPSRPILVSGSHRSGSTWVGNVLSQAEGYGYMHEPFNPIYPSPKKSPISLWYLYISAHNHDQYYSFFQETLKWNYCSRERFRGVDNRYKAMMWLKYNRIFRKNRGLLPLVKDPIAFFSAPWLAEHFDMQVIMLIRHPAAFVYSLKRKDWHFPFHHLLQQKALVNDWLKAFEPEMQAFVREPKDIIAQGCLVWRIIYSTLDAFKARWPEWQYLKHEDLSARPDTAFSQLFESMGLAYTEAVRNYVLKSSSSENPAGTSSDEEQLKRDSQANIKYWKDKLSVDELERIKTLTQDVWPTFYNENDW